ncbi:MAG: prepilin-type N-terminal cleavage/methylation domain-containing protein [Weeksellaceae bacterium]
MNSRKSKKTGFTLIEILIVIGIIGVIIPTLFTIIFIILQQQARIYRLVETKRQGDYMLTFIKEKITREAGGIVNELGETQCNVTGDQHVSSNSGDQFTFTTKNDASETFDFTTNNSILTYSENTGLTTNMHNANVQIDGIAFSCIKRTAFSQPLITVNFNVTFYDPTPTDREGTVELPYQSKFLLR